jgi:ribosomal protein L37AE/L43A
MPIRPGWYEDYWKSMDRKTSARIRTTCPRCGSAKTYYNTQYQTWRCGRCEHSFVVEGFTQKRPWWKRLLGRS